jgi:hypothetical protein
VQARARQTPPATMICITPPHPSSAATQSASPAVPEAYRDRPISSVHAAAARQVRAEHRARRHHGPSAMTAGRR